MRRRWSPIPTTSGGSHPVVSGLSPNCNASPHFSPITPVLTLVLFPHQELSASVLATRNGLRFLARPDLAANVQAIQLLEKEKLELVHCRERSTFRALKVQHPRHLPFFVVRLDNGSSCRSSTSFSAKARLQLGSNSRSM